VIRALLLLLALCAPLEARAQADPPREPFLRVEAGAHTAPVARLATDAAGRVLASVSDDKTLRLWSLPSGDPLGVLRVPIGSGEEGELYAVALSPDGGRAYAAGYTGRAWDGAFAIHIFDTASGRPLARLPGLPAPVQHLAVSEDGQRLAAALGGRAGVRVWETRTGRLLSGEENFGGPARMVAFDEAGRLAATSADGRVRLYDAQGRKLAERIVVPGARPFGVAFSPDGALLAVGFEDRLRVEVLAASDLRTVFVPDASGLAGEGLPAVTWAADGRGGVQLHAAGYARNREGRFVIRRWRDFGLGPAQDIPAAANAIAHLLPLPGGGLAFAASDPGWGRLSGDGSLALAPRPPGPDFAAAPAIAVTPDGTGIRFALRPGQPPVFFDAARGVLEPGGGGAGLLTARTESPRIPLANWRGGNQPRLGNAALRIGQGEFARSAALLPREDGFLLGTDTHLRLFDASGRPLAELATPGAVWGLAVAGEVAVAALGDGTLRWYGIGARLEERAALFVQAETRRWALWTPEALFDHSPAGGQELVGVHLNNARNAAPDWASFQQAYRALYAPAAVRARIVGDAQPARERMAGLGDVRQRIGRAPGIAPGSLCAVTPQGCVALAWGAEEAPEGATALRMGFVASDRGLGLGPLDVLVNDRIAARAETGAGEAQVEVPLDPGPNRIATRLYDAERSLFAEGPSLLLRRAGGAAPAGAGRLVVLAVGVDRQARPDLVDNLRFAVADARSVAEGLRRGSGGLFAHVEVTLLEDERATRQNILGALGAIAARSQPEDTFVLYLAGHGVRSEPDRRFLFLPHDVQSADWAVLRQQALDEDTLIAALARIRARDGFLFVDTCHAGQVTIDSLAAMGNDTGRFLLAASTSVQEALDSYDDRNGVFAFAVLEAFAGRAAADAEGRVSALAVGEFVTRRVPQLAAEKQHRQDAVFRTAQRDLRGFPLVRLAR